PVREAAGRGDPRSRDGGVAGRERAQRLPHHLHPRHHAGGARRRPYRAHGLGGPWHGSRDHRARLRGGRGRRAGQHARRRPRVADRRAGALRGGALLPAGGVVQHLSGDGAGARVAATRAVRRPGGAQDMKRLDRTTFALLASLVLLLAGGPLLPEWALFLVTNSLAKGLVVLG